MLAAKCDEDGRPEPALAIVSAGGQRLAFFNEEEVAELVRVLPQLQAHVDLWERKAAQNRTARLAAEEQLRLSQEGSNVI